MPRYELKKKQSKQDTKVQVQNNIKQTTGTSILKRMSLLMFLENTTSRPYRLVKGFISSTLKFQISSFKGG